MKENKMGVMPIRKLVIAMSLPMMISMLVQALYNIVDSIFVSQVCEDALTAVSLAFHPAVFALHSALRRGTCDPYPYYGALVLNKGSVRQAYLQL